MTRTRATAGGCPFLTGTYLMMCTATREVYAPSEFQFTEYCTGSWHSLCPLFRLRREQDGKRTPVAEPPGTRLPVGAGYQEP